MLIDDFNLDTFLIPDGPDDFGRYYTAAVKPKLTSFYTPLALSNGK